MSDTKPAAPLTAYTATEGCECGICVLVRERDAALDAARLRAALEDTFGAVAFLRSVITSGKLLDAHDTERLDDSMERAAQLLNEPDHRALAALVLPSADGRPGAWDYPADLDPMTGKDKDR